MGQGGAGRGESLRTDNESSQSETKEETKRSSTWNGVIFLRLI